MMLVLTLSCMLCVTLSLYIDVFFACVVVVVLYTSVVGADGVVTVIAVGDVVVSARGVYGVMCTARTYEVV